MSWFNEKKKIRFKLISNQSNICSNDNIRFNQQEKVIIKESKQKIQGSINFIHLFKYLTEEIILKL
ncbi:unnamed protein product [Paramecium sonneborni]|uniref:Uncharacterized protein n=1 Tax=Paramecium sonneborni TaxID=65129 RepID=A0A8S1LAQ1_9CILI|nr:unnamed protein product [Paramecium sonneborni]